MNRSITMLEWEGQLLVLFKEVEKRPDLFILRLGSPGASGG
jgi:hypothetical protein